MSTKQVIIIFRKLNDTTGWVNSCVHAFPSDINNEQAERFADNMVAVEKNRITELFVEFQHARFGYCVMPLNGNPTMPVGQVVVVSRKLNSTTDWVVSAVKNIPNDIDSVSSFTDSIMEDEKERVVKKFVEFRQATWKNEVFDLE
jgi:hypothetical protein